MSESYVGAAAEAVLKAGAIQKARYGDTLEIRHKGEIDLVTDVDNACEAAILALLRERFPSHDIVTEETETESTGSPFIWYIDPLDGTTNYAHGYPAFAASVALTHEDRIIAGAVYEPLRGELYTAEAGEGAYLNGRRLHVSAAPRLIESLLLTGFPYDLREDVPGKSRLFTRFLAEARAVRRDGSAALDFCYLAAGRIDGFWEERLAPWDMMAGLLLIEEAGGRTSRFDGTPIRRTADEVLATNGLIHDEMLRHLREDREGRERKTKVS